MSRITLGASLIAGIFFGIPLAAAAQAFTSTDPFTVSVAPQYPAPFQPITLSFLSSTLDLANTTLSVSVDGKQAYQGSVQPVSVPLGQAGQTLVIKVTIKQNGVASSKTLNITPQDVSLVAEPVASVPPLYPGKPVVPLGGTTRVVAVANIRTPGGIAIDPSALSYEWTIDHAFIQDSSGIGKNTIVVASPLQYRSRSISVVVKSQDGSLVGGASLSLSPQEPSVRLYENTPLAGIRFDHALAGAYTIAGSEVSLFAAPFSFPISSGAPALTWFLNGSSVQSGSSVTLRPSGTGQGSANLSLSASTGDYSNATAALSLIFGASSGTNFFGL